MATVHETVRNAVWRWIQDVRGWTDAQAADLAIPAERGTPKGQRPSPPFLVIRIDILGQTVGTDEKTYRADGRHTKGDRRGLVNIQGFGLATSDWLEEIAMNIDLAPSPLTVNTIGELVDVSELTGTSIEARFSRDFNIAYRLFDGPRDFTEAVAVSGEVEADDIDAIPLDVDWS